jgi:hypothetical protein
MKIRHAVCLGLLAAGAATTLAAADAGMAGKWKLKPSLGSSIKPWDSETLTITVQGDTVRLDRRLGWGHDRHVSDSTTVTADGRTVSSVPVPHWLDTWYSNAYIGGDHHKRVCGKWITPGQVLQVESSLTLDLQQGDVPVHLYDEYHLSPDGKTLTQIEIRSTRDQALTYVFTRD